jgi:hypothetical protein
MVTVVQRSAIESICDNLASGIKHSLLIAQPQSGKSKTFIWAAFEVLRQHLEGIHQVLFVCGSNDKSLKAQLQSNITKEFREYKYSLEERGELPSLRDLDHIQDNCHQVLFSQDITPENIKRKGITVDAKTLIVWDESHYAQTRGNRPDWFFKHFDVGANGSSYMLSVSATPFSEYCDIVQHKQSKGIVVLQPDLGYRGFPWFMHHGLVRFYDKGEAIDELQTALDEHTRSESFGYAIVRGGQGDLDSYMVREIAKSIGWSFITYDSSNQSDIQNIDILESAPIRNTVVFVTGMLRMGKNVPKSHIIFVFESSECPNTDTVIQGLGGRMCGYGHVNDVPIYLSKDIEEDARRYINWIEELQTCGSSECVPKNAMNVKEKDTATPCGYVPMRPILLVGEDIDALATVFSRRISLYGRQRVCELTKSRLLAMDSAEVGAAEAYAEFREKIEGLTEDKISCRDGYEGSSYATDNIIGRFLKRKPSLYWTEKEKVTVMFVRKGVCKAPCFTLVVQVYMVAPPVANADAKVPVTSGMEVFKDCVDGGVADGDNDIENNIDLMWKTTNWKDLAMSLRIKGVKKRDEIVMAIVEKLELDPYIAELLCARRDELLLKAKEMRIPRYHHLGVGELCREIYERS